MRPVRATAMDQPDTAGCTCPYLANRHIDKFESWNQFPHLIQRTVFCLASPKKRQITRYSLLFSVNYNLDAPV